MRKNRYNFNESEFENMKKLLKELPKEKADDNFEYNLMIKINNGNFEQSGNYEEQKISLWKIFVPGGVIVTTVLLFFFMLNVSEDNSENLFRTIPQLRTETSEQLNIPISLKENIFGKHKITEQDVVLIEPEIKDKSQNIKPTKKTNKNSIKHQGMAALPFNLSNSTNLDVAIHNSRNRKNSKINDGRASLAGMNNSNSMFYGFFLGEELDRSEVQAMKARIDSIKKYKKMRK